MLLQSLLSVESIWWYSKVLLIKFFLTTHLCWVCYEGVFFLSLYFWTDSPFIYFPLLLSLRFHASFLVYSHYFDYLPDLFYISLTPFWGLYLSLCLCHSVFYLSFFFCLPSFHPSSSAFSLPMAHGLSPNSCQVFLSAAASCSICLVLPLSFISGSYSHLHVSRSPYISFSLWVPLKDLSSTIPSVNPSSLSQVRSWSRSFTLPNL